MQSSNLVFTLLPIRNSERDTNSYLPSPAVASGGYDAAQLYRNKLELQTLVFLAKKAKRPPCKWANKSLDCQGFIVELLLLCSVLLLLIEIYDAAVMEL